MKEVGVSAEDTCDTRSARPVQHIVVQIVYRSQRTKKAEGTIPCPPLLFELLLLLEGPHRARRSLPEKQARKQE